MFVKHTVRHICVYDRETEIDSFHLVQQKALGFCMYVRKLGCQGSLKATAGIGQCSSGA